MWYQAYGWKENPFSIRPSPRLVGLEEIKEALRADTFSGNLVLLLGATGRGKTSLLLWLSQELSKSGLRPVYLNLHHLPVPQVLSLKSQLRRYQSIVDRLFHRLPRGLVLLIDEAQEVPEDVANLLKAYFDGGQILSAVLAACEEPRVPLPLRSRIGPNVYHLEDPPEALGVALVKHRMNGRQPFTEEALVEIVRRAGPSPRSILQACELVCKRLCAKAEVGELITLADVEALFPRDEALTSPGTLETSETRQPRRDGQAETGETSETAEARQPENQGLEDTYPPARQREPVLVKAEVTIPNLSPMQWDIVRLLLEGPKTTAELEARLQSTADSIRRQLSRLRHPGPDLPPLVEIVSDRIPKTYGLTPWAREWLKSLS